MSAYAETDWTACGLPTEHGHNAFSIVRPIKALTEIEKRREYERQYQRERYAAKKAGEKYSRMTGRTRVVTPAQRAAKAKQQAIYRASPAGIAATQRQYEARRKV